MAVFMPEELDNKGNQMLEKLMDRVQFLLQEVQKYNNEHRNLKEQLEQTYTNLCKSLGQYNESLSILEQFKSEQKK
jgi:CII-binding regulator of phage lambda lysogenization HflD